MSTENLEIEKQFSGLNMIEFKKLLIENGAEIVKKNRIMRYTVFKHPSGNYDRYIRIRDEGDKVTMTSKENLKKEFVTEYEVEIDSYDMGIKIFKSLGCKPKYTIEKTRETWTIPSISYKNEIVIDGYPGLHPIVEVECENVETLNHIIDLLNLKDKKHTSVTNMYLKLFNIKFKKIKNEYSEQMTFKNIANETINNKNECSDIHMFTSILKDQLIEHQVYCYDNNKEFPNELLNTLQSLYTSINKDNEKVKKKIDKDIDNLIDSISKTINNNLLLDTNVSDETI